MKNDTRKIEGLIVNERGGTDFRWCLRILSLLIRQMRERKALIKQMTQERSKEEWTQLGHALGFSGEDKQVIRLGLAKIKKEKTAFRNEYEAGEVFQEFLKILADMFPFVVLNNWFDPHGMGSANGAQIDILEGELNKIFKSG